MSESKFVVDIRPVYEKLIELWDEFNKADISDPVLTLELIAGLKQAERNVLLTWAKATSDINPGMLEDIESGRLKWYPALDEYLNRMLYEAYREVTITSLPHASHLQTDS